MILHLPFMGAGLVFKEGENETQAKYLAAHHELVASAEATRIAHEIDPENKVGCMLAAGQTYPYSCAPEDVWKAMGKDRENYFLYRQEVNIRLMQRNSSKEKVSSSILQKKMKNS